MTIAEDRLLGAALFVGLAMKKNPCQVDPGLPRSIFPTGSGRPWRCCYGLFCGACAVANEVVRRTQSDHTWVLFRGGALAAAVLFGLAQARSSSSYQRGRRWLARRSRRRTSGVNRGLRHRRMVCRQPDAKMRYHLAGENTTGERQGRHGQASEVRPSQDAFRQVTHLLARTLQLALDFHAEAAGPGAITQQDSSTVLAAAARDGLTQNDLVRATGIDRSTLADLAVRMLGQGLLSPRGFDHRRQGQQRAAVRGQDGRAGGRIGPGHRRRRPGCSASCRPRNARAF